MNVPTRADLEARRLLAVAEWACEPYYVAIDDMLSRRKTRSLCLARADFYRALRGFGWSLPEIARFMRRDHTTILAAIKPETVKAEERREYSAYRAAMREAGAA